MQSWPAHFKRVLYNCWGRGWFKGGIETSQGPGKTLMGGITDKCDIAYLRNGMNMRVQCKFVQYNQWSRESGFEPSVPLSHKTRAGGIQLKIKR